MTPFFLSLFFIGILIVLSVLVMVTADYMKPLSENKEKLKEQKVLSDIVDDAEQMAEELNRLSEYIVTTVEEKTGKLADIMDKADLRISKFSEIINECSKPAQPFVQGIDTEMQCLNEGMESKQQKITSDTIAEEAFPEIIEDQNNNNIQSGFGENVKNRLSRMNLKQKEVMRLAEMGMNETEIARELKIGKGEIALILDINK